MRAASAGPTRGSASSSAALARFSSSGPDTRDRGAGLRTSRVGSAPGPRPSVAIARRATQTPSAARGEDRACIALHREDRLTVAVAAGCAAQYAAQKSDPDPGHGPRPFLAEGVSQTLPRPSESAGAPTQPSTPARSVRRTRIELAGSGTGTAAQSFVPGSSSTSIRQFGPGGTASPDRTSEPTYQAARQVRLASRMAARCALP